MVAWAILPVGPLGRKSVGAPDSIGQSEKFMKYSLKRVLKYYKLQEGSPLAYARGLRSKGNAGGQCRGNALWSPKTALPGPRRSLFSPRKAFRSSGKALWSPQEETLCSLRKGGGGFENPGPKNRPMATPGDPGPFGSGRVHLHLEYK